MNCTHNPANEFSKQLTERGQPSCYDVMGSLFSFTSKDSASFIAQAKVDIDRNTMNLTLANCSVTVVGQSNTEQVSHSFCCNDDGVQCDSSPKDGNCSERQRGKTESLVRAFDDLQGCEVPTPVHDIEPQLPVIERTGYLNGKQCEQIMERLEDLQDNGQFEEHNRLVTSYMEYFMRKGNTDMQMAMMIERGVAFSYQKKSLKESKQLFSSAIDFGSTYQLRNPNILLARAYYRFVQACRYQNSKKLPLLRQFLERGEFLLQNHESPEDLAEIYYNYGSIYLMHMSTIPDDERNAEARNKYQRMVKKYFENTIEAGKKDPRERVRVKKQIYGHLRVAAVLLDCISTVARTRIKVIPPQDIADAVKHLDILEHQLSDVIPRGTRVQILKTRSDQYYRQGRAMYPLAKKTAEEALEIAQHHEFTTELSSLQERIDFLQQLCHGIPQRENIKSPFGNESETSSNDGSGETSASETEQKCSS